jgi:NADPH:quinone reductase-like Zn-dependent oxidoreductase
VESVRVDRHESSGDHLLRRPEGLDVVDVPDPVAAPGQVLIAPAAIGVGGVDAVIRRGIVDGYGFAEGLIPGSEGPAG